MLLYSQTIVSFISRLKKDARAIIQNEMGLKTYRNRFLFKSYLIPLNIVVFEKKNIFGHFEPHTYQIGLHKSLIYTAKDEVIKNILRHELAHLINYLEHGDSDSPHGEKFKQVCKRYRWGTEVVAAKMNLEIANQETQSQDVDKILSKISKLLRLAESSNQHESQLATIKANQLLLQHNLNALKNSQEEIVYVKQILQGKKNCAKFRAIYEILKYFFVSPVFNYGKQGFYLEVIGSRANVELADYVGNFLHHELEHLWQLAQQENPALKGIVAKNSFMKGVEQGYVAKLQQTQDEITNNKSLMIIRHNLTQQLQLVYPRLSHSYSQQTQVCPIASNLGVQKGKNLNINPALKKKGKITLPLAFFKS